VKHRATAPPACLPSRAVAARASTRFSRNPIRTAGAILSTLLVGAASLALANPGRAPTDTLGHGTDPAPQGPRGLFVEPDGWRAFLEHVAIQVGETPPESPAERLVRGTDPRPFSGDPLLLAGGPPSRGPNSAAQNDPTLDAAPGTTVETARRWERARGFVALRGAAVGTHAWRPARWPAPLLPWRPRHPDQMRGRWQARAAGRLDLPGGFVLHQELVVDSDPALDPAARVKQYDQVSASIEIPTATVGYRRGGFAAVIGRSWQRWGPGWTGSLILDDRHPPGDGFGLAYAGRSWTLAYRLERLDQLAVAGQAGTKLWGRYLAVHRLTVALGEAWHLGIAETALVAADGAPPLWAFNPLLPWLLTQQEGRSALFEGANINWALEVSWRPASGWAVYGQGLLDDIMIDSADREVFPDQLGGLVGAVGPLTRSGPWRTRIGWGLEYTRIGTWTYVHRQPELRYSAWGAPLGHPAGPDSETLSAFLSATGAGGAPRGLLWGRWHSKGRIHLNTAESSVGQVDLPFPSPPVARWLQVGVALQLLAPGPSEIDLRLGWTENRREDMTSGYAEDDPWTPPAEQSEGVWAAVAWTLTLGPWGGGL